MKYLLDTNTCIVYLKGKNLNLQQKFNAIFLQELASQSKTTREKLMVMEELEITV